METLEAVVQRIFSAPDRRPIYAWAADHLYMPSVLTHAGLFNPNISRHFLAPLDALKSDRVRKVTLMGPTRGGKSLIADLWTVWQIVNDPGAMMANFQTDPDAKDFSNDRLGWMIANCGPARALMTVGNIQEKKFSHGFPLYIQGPSLGNFQAKGIRYLRNEELWMWEPGRYQQAAARIGDWKKIHMSKIFNLGQGGVEGDDMDREWNEGDKQEWFAPCMECGKSFQLDISGRRDDGSIWGLRWDDNARTKDKFGDWKLPEVKRKVWYECLHCKFQHVDEDRTKEHWNRHGYYVRTRPEASEDEVSFHYSAIISDLWADLAAGFCSAMNSLHVGVLEPLVSWTQKQEARSWSEKRLVKNKASSTFRPEVGDWKEEVHRFMTIDCQAEGVYWVMIRAWSKRGESRRLWFGKLHSEAELEAKQKEFRVLNNHVLIDSGAFTRLVYAMCCRHGWIALKGEDKKAFIHNATIKGKSVKVLRSYSELRRGDPEAGERVQGMRFAQLILWSNPTIKDRLQRQINLGLWREPETNPGDMDEAEYARQFASEYRSEKRDPETGQVEGFWVCPTGNNHLRDDACMQMVGATLVRILPDFIAEPDDAAYKEAA